MGGLILPEGLQWNLACNQDTTSIHFIPEILGCVSRCSHLGGQPGLRGLVLITCFRVIQSW
jgi:hypothetical protein